MGKKRRNFSKDFKLNILYEIEGGKSVSQVSRENEIHPTLITKWRSEYKKYGDQAFAGNGKLYKDEAKVSEMERMIGQLTMENNLLKKALNSLKKKE